jgi:cytochrome c biogenesis protein CcmG/thiol:disulfide interchange protein DsbE
LQTGVTPLPRGALKQPPLKPWQRSREMKLSRLLPVGLFGVLVIFLAIGLTRDPSVIPTEMIDREMPDFELPELRDETAMVSQADLVGQVTLVNVFGSWCVACLQEHPTLMQLSQSETVRIVGINWRDDREDALAWLAKHGDPYQAIVFDAESELVIEIGVTGAPETFVLDASGRIRYKQIGPITPEVWTRTIVPVIEAIESEAVS